MRSRKRERGRMEKGASFAGYVATVSQPARFNLATRSWHLGPRLGFSVTRSYGTIFAQSCNLWGLGLPGHKGYGFRQASHTASSQRCGSGFGTLLEAVGEGSLPGFCGSSAWLLQGWPRFRRWRGAGRAAALGQSNGDVAATLAGSAQSQCQAACRPGGYGRAIAKAFTRRGRQCVQDIQALRRFGSRLHQPQGNFAVASRFASAFHRPAHGVRGKVDQTFELVSHDGVEAQAVRRSSHNRPHGGSAAGLVAASKAAGAAVGERARCALFLGLSRQSLRPCRLGPLHHGGGSTGRAAIGGFLVTRSGQVLRACRARPPLGRRPEKPGSPHDCWLVGAPRTKAGVFSRPTSAPLFLSVPLGPFCQVAVGPRQPPNSCWQLSWKQ